MPITQQHIITTITHSTSNKIMMLTIIGKIITTIFVVGRVIAVGWEAMDVTVTSV